MSEQVYEQESCKMMLLYRILTCKLTNVGSLTTDERKVKLSLSRAIQARTYMMEQLFQQTGDQIAAETDKRSSESTPKSPELDPNA